MLRGGSGHVTSSAWASSGMFESGTVQCPGCRLHVAESEYANHTLGCDAFEQTVQQQYPSLPETLGLYGVTSSYGFGFQGSYYVCSSSSEPDGSAASSDDDSDAECAPQHHSQQCHQPAARCLSTNGSGGWVLPSAAQEPVLLPPVPSAENEARVRLPARWQQRYVQMGERLVEPVEVDTQRARRVAVVGPIGQGKGAIINNLMRGHYAEVGKGRGNGNAPDPFAFTNSLLLQDVPGYNGLHERQRTWLEWVMGYRDLRPVDKTFRNCSDFIKYYSSIFDTTDAVMYVLSHRGLATDAHILRELAMSGKMVFLVITHCEELRHYGEFYGPEAQAHRADIRRDTLAAMGAVDEAMAAVFERMPTFLVQCPWPKNGFHPSQARIISEYLSSNCSAFDFPALRSWLESPRGLLGTLRLHSRLAACVSAELEDYIMRTTGSMEVFLKALAMFGADVAAPGFLSFGMVAISSMWTLLDMMDLVGLMEGADLPVEREGVEGTGCCSATAADAAAGEEDSRTDVWAACSTGDDDEGCGMGLSVRRSSSQPGSSGGAPVATETVGGGWRERFKAVFTVHAWDVAVLSSGAKAPLQGIMTTVVTKKLHEVFGQKFFERMLQAMVAAVIRDVCMNLVAYSVPFVGAAVYYASVRPFMRRIARSVAAQAIPLHRVWIEQNTRVLLPTPKARSVPRSAMA